MGFPIFHRRQARYVNFFGIRAGARRTHFLGCVGAWVRIHGPWWPFSESVQELLHENGIESILRASRAHVLMDHKSLHTLGVYILSSALTNWPQSDTKAIPKWPQSDPKMIIKPLTKPDQTRPNQARPDQTRPYQGRKPSLQRYHSMG